MASQAPQLEAEVLTDGDFQFYSSAMVKKQEGDFLWNFVQSVLVPKYGLKDGDQITPEGSILRLSRKEDKK